MRKYDVRSINQAFAYITDCLLATVYSEAIRKGRAKYAFERHVSIAQTACDWMRDMGIDASTTRAKDIIGKCTVKEWAEKYMPEYKEKNQ